MRDLRSRRPPEPKNASGPERPGAARVEAEKRYGQDVGKADRRLDGREGRPLRVDLRVRNAGLRVERPAS